MLAVVFFTPSVCRAGNEIYVAGMPESWPFEFYDEKEETYQGVLPELLEEAGEAAGIGVKYIKPSKKDRRLDLAGNIQADAVWTLGLTEDEIKDAGLKKGRDLILYEEDGKPAARTAKVLAATPMGRFGRPEELNGALMFLLNNEAAGFITGIILPVDGGFSAYSGV